MMTFISDRDWLHGLRPGPTFFGGEPCSVSASKHKFYGGEHLKETASVNRSLLEAGTLILTAFINWFYKAGKHDRVGK